MRNYKMNYETYTISFLMMSMSIFKYLFYPYVLFNLTLSFSSTCMRCFLSTSFLWFSDSLGIIRLISSYFSWYSAWLCLYWSSRIRYRLYVKDYLLITIMIWQIRCLLTFFHVPISLCTHQLLSEDVMLQFHICLQ